MSEDVIPPTDLDRLLSAFRKLVRAEFPQLTYMGIWEYSVQATDGTLLSPSTTVDCSPIDTAIPLPTLAKVPLRAGIMGEQVTPQVGARCLIAFINGDPTKPICISVDQIVAIFIAGGKPTQGAARTGDPVAGAAIGAPTSTKVFIGG